MYMYLLAGKLPVKYIENPLSLLNEQWRWDFSKINDLSQEDAVLINCSLENWGTGPFIQNLYNELEQAGVNFLILTHIWEDHLVKPNMIYHPYWYHEKVVYGLNHTLTSLPQVIRPQLTDLKKYKLSCLHGNPRPHRILNYFKMQEYQSNDILIGIFNNPHGVDQRFDEDFKLSTDLTDRWLKINPFLPTRHQIHEKEGFPKWSDVGIDVGHPAFTDSYINIVPETTIINRVHQTEKIWKAVLSGQMFVALANPFYIDRLRKQGVDVYDDIIDHNYYDSELDFEKRFNKLHNLIEHLLTLDLLSINTDLHNRRQQNIDKFYAGEFDPHINDLLQAIRKLINNDRYEFPSN